MKTYTVKNIKYIEIKIPKNIGLLCKAKPYIVNIRFCHCIILTNIPILTTGTLNGEVQIGQILKNYTVNRNMLSELCVVKIDCHKLENSLRSVVKFLMYIK